MGKEGGKETLRRHGKEHFRELGRKGIRAVADRYFGGKIGEAMEYLRLKGRELQHASGVDAKLEQQLAAGAEIAVEELPAVLHPEDDPFYQPGWTERVRQSQRARDVDIPL